MIFLSSLDFLMGIYYVQIYNYEEKEEVKVVHKTSEVRTKEYEKAAKRLGNANLVILLKTS